MAKTSLSLSSSTASRRVFHRFFSTSRSVSPSPLHSNLISRRRSSPSSSLFHLIGFIPRFTTIRTIGTDRDAEFESKFSYLRPTDKPGCDYKHWGVFFYKKPGGKYATKQQMIDCYVQTLAKVVGSEEEAKRKIYKVEWNTWYGFGCETYPDIAEDLCERCPEVHFVYPDFYDDPENKDYGGERLVNGELVPRPPERKRRLRF